jgi:hypothetical protein
MCEINNVEAFGTSAPSPIDTVPYRLGKLEADNRRLKRLLVLGVLVLVAGLTMAQTRPLGVVQAQGFELRDSSGVLLAQLVPDETGYPRFALLDKNGVVKADFRVSENSTFMFFRNSQGKTLVEASVFDGDTGGAVTLRRPSTQFPYININLQAPDSISPFIQVRDATNQVLFTTDIH